MLRRLSTLTTTATIVLIALTLAGCGTSNEESTPSKTETPQPRASGEDGPAATGGRAGMQVTEITIAGNKFDPARIEAAAGVVTLRLHNESDKPLRLALREGKQLLTEGGPASGKQVSEITVPVEAGKTYQYYTAGNEQSGLRGQLVVAP